MKLIKFVKITILILLALTYFLILIFFATPTIQSSGISVIQRNNDINLHWKSDKEVLTFLVETMSDNGSIQESKFYGVKEVQTNIPIPNDGSKALTIYTFDSLDNTNILKINIK